MTDSRPPGEIEGRRTVPAGLVLVTGLIALGLGTLLNAGSLLKTAERQPLGSTRLPRPDSSRPWSAMKTYGKSFTDSP